MDDFLKKLHNFYNSKYHQTWLENISKAVKEVSPYLEDGFFTNHFEHFEFLNGGIKKNDYFKFRQGMWHLHMMSFFLKNGFKLLKPTGKDDIEIDMSDFKIYIECTCPGWGGKDKYISKTYTGMSKGLTEMDKLHENFIEKSVYSIENKIGDQIKKRKESQNGFYLVAFNESLLINGFNKWNNKGLGDRASSVISRIDNHILDGTIYGSISESSYCQTKNKLICKLNSSDERIVKIFKRLSWISNL